MVPSTAIRVRSAQAIAARAGRAPPLGVTGWQRASQWRGVSTVLRPDSALATRGALEANDDVQQARAGMLLERARMGPDFGTAPIERSPDPAACPARGSPPVAVVILSGIESPGRCSLRSALRGRFGLDDLRPFGEPPEPA